MESVLVAFTNPPSLNEFMVAWLADYGLDSFEDRPDGLDAYVDRSRFNEEKFRKYLADHFVLKNIRYEISFIAEQNWNTEWEKNFQPILVDGKISVRAPFHPPAKNFTYEIIIEPKMSFGTGHHATTALMIRQLSRMQLTGKKVLDMGCGSGILAILAAKMGAAEVHAVDTDEWAVENSVENCARNNTQQIHVQKGNAASLIDRRFDVILANINRNTLLEDLPVYADCLVSGGELVLSGFYTEDRGKILERTNCLGLSFTEEKVNEQWIAMSFSKGITDKS